MIKKKFLPVRSSASSPNLTKLAQPSKSKRTLPVEKKSSDSSLENVYRLPSSLKRTEEMINKSVLQRQISSKILDIVGTTFRMKNANPSQEQYFYSPTNFTQFLKYKEYASSEFLDTLYEVEGEDSDDDSIQTDATHEVSSLSICTEETIKIEDISLNTLSKKSHGSFLEALDKITNQSTLITTQDRRAYSSSLLLDDSKSARGPASTSRAKNRDNDLWKQVKEAIASKKMTYSLVETVPKTGEEKKMRTSTSNIKNIKKDKRELSTIQRDLERDVKRLENRVKRFSEKENRLDRKSLQNAKICQESLHEEVKNEDIFTVKIKEEHTEETEVNQTELVDSTKAQEVEENIMSMQGDIVDNKSKQNVIKGRLSKDLIKPIGNQDILKKNSSSYQVKSQLLEPKRRMELEIKTKTLSSRKE